MGGTEALILSTIGSMVGMTSKKPDNSGQLEQERAAREEEQRQQQADDRKRDRAKITEARELEKRRKHSTLSSGAASLVEDDPEVATTGLKKKLGE